MQQTYFSAIKSLVWVLAWLCLTACGFQLRHQPLLPAPLHTLYLQSTDPYGQFEAILKRSLQLSGATLVNNSNQAPFILDIQNKTFYSTAASIGTSTQARVYSLVYLVTFTLSDQHGRTLSGPQTVSASGTLTLNANQLLESNDQQPQMIAQLEHNDAQQIITQLNSPQVLEALGQIPSLPLTTPIHP
jgi:LPS-assembly lipoprotein